MISFKDLLPGPQLKSGHKFSTLAESPLRIAFKIVAKNGQKS